MLNKNVDEKICGCGFSFIVFWNFQLHLIDALKTSCRSPSEYQEMLFNLRNTFKVTYGRLLFYAQWTLLWFNFTPKWIFVSFPNTPKKTSTTWI